MKRLSFLLLAATMALLSCNNGKPTTQRSQKDTATDSVRPSAVAPPIPKENIRKGHVVNKTRNIHQNPPIDTKEKPIDPDLIK